MNKTELATIVSEKSGMSKKDSEHVVTLALDAIKEAVEAGEKVQLAGFGIFDVKTRAARMGRNPKTKEEIEIPASRVPLFKASKAFKDSVDK